MKTPFISIILVSFFTSIVIGPMTVHAQEMITLPKPGVMVHLSPEFTPASLQGMTIHTDNALQFDFLIQRGDSPLSDSQKKEEYNKLVKYFLASLTVPDDDQWVNLSPYEKNRIIQDNFGKTEMGRDLLAQDYILKQITSSLIYPEDSLGKKFWDKIYDQAWKEFHTTNVPVNTFNKVWIVPDEAAVYESGNTVYVLRNHLKVMLEEDYLSLQKHSGIETAPDNKAHAIASQIVREIVIPALEKEVNEGKNFANLRQIYSGMILATWYKHALKESLLSKVYANQAKVKGVDQADPKTNEAIYQQYLKAFKKGVFNYIKEDVDKYTNETIPRKFFSGGAKDFSALVRGSEAVTRGFQDAAVLVYDPNTGIPPKVLAKIDGAVLGNNIDRAAIVLNADKDMAMTVFRNKLLGWGVTALVIGQMVIGANNLNAQNVSNLTSNGQTQELAATGWRIEDGKAVRYLHIGTKWYKQEGVIDSTGTPVRSRVPMPAIAIEGNPPPLSAQPSVQAPSRTPAPAQTPARNPTPVQPRVPVQAPARNPGQTPAKPPQVPTQTPAKTSATSVPSSAQKTPVLTFKDGTVVKVGNVYEIPGFPIYDTNINQTVTIKRIRVVGIKSEGTFGEFRISTDYLDAKGKVINDLHSSTFLPPRQLGPSWTLKANPMAVQYKDGFSLTVGEELNYETGFIVGDNKIVTRVRVTSITPGEDGFGHRFYDIRLEDISPTRRKGTTYILGQSQVETANHPPELKKLVIINDKMMGVEVDHAQITRSSVQALGFDIDRISIGSNVSEIQVRAINELKRQARNLVNQSRQPNTSQVQLNSIGSQLSLIRQDISQRLANRSPRWQLEEDESMMVESMVEELKQQVGLSIGQMREDVQQNGPQLGVSFSAARGRLTMMLTNGPLSRDSLAQEIAHQLSILLISQSDVLKALDIIEGRLGGLINRVSENLQGKLQLANRDVSYVQAAFQTSKYNRTNWKRDQGRAENFSYYGQNINDSLSRVRTYLSSLISTLEKAEPFALHPENIASVLQEARNLQEFLRTMIPDNFVRLEDETIRQQSASIDHIATSLSGMISTTGRGAVVNQPQKVPVLMQRLRALLRWAGVGSILLTANLHPSNVSAFTMGHEAASIQQVQSSTKGGIDLNSANLNLQIKRDGRGVPLPLSQQDMASLSRIQGFIPEIVEIGPATNLPIISELQQKLQANPTIA